MKLKIEDLSSYDKEYLTEKKKKINQRYVRRHETLGLKGSWDLEIKTKESINVPYKMDLHYFRKVIFVGSDINSNTVDVSLKEKLKTFELYYFDLKRPEKKRKRKEIFKNALVIVSPLESKEFMKTYGKETSKQKSSVFIWDLLSDKKFEVNEMGKITLKDNHKTLKLRLGFKDQSYESLCIRYNLLIQFLKENNSIEKTRIKRTHHKAKVISHV